MDVKFCRIKRNAPWGDYGNTLAHGEAFHEDGVLQVDRVGPFVPPFTEPGSVLVVTDQARAELEQCELFDVGFAPVNIRKVVEIHWEAWDRAADIPEVPEDGEPESFILARPHSAAVAEAIGQLWEVIIPPGADIDTDSRRSPGDYDIRVHLATWNGAHLFRDYKVHVREAGPYIITTQAGMDWLNERCDEWLAFLPCLVK